MEAHKRQFRRTMEDVSDSFYAVSNVRIFEMSASKSEDPKQAKTDIEVHKTYKNAVMIKGRIGSKECLAIVLYSKILYLN